MKIKNAIFAVLSVVATSLFCKYFNDMGVDGWYANAQKPSITPPNYIFPIVWNILYILFAISFYKILSNKKENKKAICLYFVQLILQVVWCAVFFANQQIELGVIILIFMNVMAIQMLRSFKVIDKNAFFMLVPYCFWLVFALLLNICYLNV